MKVIINADDFGLAPGQNQGTIDTYQNGVVTSTTMMMNGDYVDEAIQLAKDNPGLGVGVHFTLDAGRPILPVHEVPSLVDDEGFFHRFNVSEPLDVNVDEVKKELKAQIDKAIKAGIDVSHLDSHHHIHLNPTIFETFVQVASDYKLPIRMSFNKDTQDFYKEIINRYNCPYVICNFDFYLENLNPEFFENLKDLAQGEEVLEIMTHPAIVDDVIRQKSSYNSHRGIEYEVLQDQKTKEITKQYNLINYHDLKKEAIA